MNITAKEARETTVFVIEDQADPQVVQTTLYDHIMASAEETTSPRGVERKLHFKEVEQQCSCWNDSEDTFSPECEKCYRGYELVYKVYEWVGQKAALHEVFDYVEQAEDFIFQRTYNFDFWKDDQRYTEWYDTYEDAYNEVIRLFAEANYIDIPVAANIKRKQELLKQLRIQQDIERKQAEMERINNIAALYTKVIEPIEGESYKETAKRLSNAIGSRIEKKVFHIAVKLIRTRQNSLKKENKE